ncbi:hypothetical protein EXD76_00930 [BEV proteobacterium]|nr:hypothetical protein [Candidatus Symbiopectobacterium sp. Chty_BC]
MNKQILCWQPSETTDPRNENHAVRLNEKTVHLRGQAFSIKTGWVKQHDSLLFNKAIRDKYITTCQQAAMQSGFP